MSFRTNTLSPVKSISLSGQVQKQLTQLANLALLPTLAAFPCWLRPRPTHSALSYPHLALLCTRVRTLLPELPGSGWLPTMWSSRASSEICSKKVTLSLKT